MERAHDTAVTELVGSHIISAFGEGSTLNYEVCMTPGATCLAVTDTPFGVPVTLPLGLLPRPEGDADTTEYAVELAYRAAVAALGQCYVDPSSPRTVIIVSTTKGCLPYGDSCEVSPERSLTYIADGLAARLGNPAPTVSVSNACVSGVSAQITAASLLERGVYDAAVIVGIDMLSRFIISGFSSFKSLSANICRPFDAGRDGLSLGEAVAAMVLRRNATPAPGACVLRAGSTHNDANHISGPSRVGEGSYRVLTDLCAAVADRSDIAFICPHGTATLYNDEMESIAIHRAALDDVPVMALKPRYGHTLGAAGVLETILCVEALRAGAIPGLSRYTECGVTYPLNISTDARGVSGRSFIKLLSGFGGVNAGVLYSIL